MKIKDFKSHTIKRSNPPHFDDYHSYKPYLIKDFSNRCAYCNLFDKSITTPFEIDHFIPQKAFKTKKQELETDYNNLIYACKKCNNSKSSKFEGDLDLDNPTNNLFYDPVLVDYNTIFFRNEFGAIASEDKKGKKMIELLKLYRPIHILAWICDEINQTADKLENAINSIKREDVKSEYEKVLNILNSQYRKFSNLLLAAYNDNGFELKGLQKQ